MKTRFVALLLIVLGIVWLARRASDPQRVVQESETVVSLAPSSESSVDSVAIQRPSSEQERNLILRAEDLQQTLVLESQKLEAQRQAVEGLLQRRQAVVEGLPTLNRTEALGQIAENTDEIQSLMEDLLQSQDTENEIHRRAEDAIKNQDSQARVARESLQDQINLLESEIRNNQEDYTYWQLNTSYVNEREDRLLSLQQVLDLQLLDLQNLREQLLQVSQIVLENQRQIQTERAVSLREVASQRQEMRGQIKDLRSLTQEIQDQIYSGRRSPMSLNVQLSQAQKNYEEQEQKVRALQESLLNTEESLKSLQR